METTIDRSGFRALGIHDRESLTALRSAAENPNTALSFPSLFTWAEPLGLCFAQHGNFGVVYSADADGYFCPMGDRDACIAWLDAMRGTGRPFKLMYLTPEQAQSLAQTYHVRTGLNRDLSEYLYETDALAFRTKPSRNFKEKVHWFQRRFRYEVLPVTGDEMCYLRTTLQEDERRNDPDAPVLRCMIEHFDEMHLSGVLLRDHDNDNYAFIIGYENTPDIFTMSVVKASPEWQSISVAVCEHEFARTLGSQYRYVDLEEDLGIPGLRNVKQLTVPCRMLDAWEAYFE